MLKINWYVDDCQNSSYFHLIFFVELALAFLFLEHQSPTLSISILDIDLNLNLEKSLYYGKT